MFNIFIFGIIVSLIAIMTIIIYKKSSYIERNGDMVNKPTIAFVFDLDQTLGEFNEISMFIESVSRYRAENKYPSLNNTMKFAILDLFPQVFRPDIFNILNKIKFATRNNIHARRKNVNIYMYTNNQGDKEWPQLIADYFQYKLGYKVFDYVIAAFKNYKNEPVEKCRTTHEKTIGDFFACTKLPSSATQICFVDDLVHSGMRTDNVYYININPYHFSYSFFDMSVKYYHMLFINETKNNQGSNEAIDQEFIKTIISFMKQYSGYTQSRFNPPDEEARISNYLKQHINTFLDIQMK